MHPHLAGCRTVWRRRHAASHDSLQNTGAWPAVQHIEAGANEGAPRARPCKRPSHEAHCSDAPSPSLRSLLQVSRAPCAHSPVPAVTTAYPGSQVARTLGTLPWLLHSLAAPAAATGGADTGAARGRQGGCACAPAARLWWLTLPLLQHALVADRTGGSEQRAEPNSGPTVSRGV